MQEENKNAESKKMWWDRWPGGHGGRTQLSHALEPAEGPDLISGHHRCSIRIFEDPYIFIFEHIPLLLPKLQHSSPGYRGKLYLRAAQTISSGDKVNPSPKFPHSLHTPCPFSLVLQGHLPFYDCWLLISALHRALSYRHV